MWPAPAGSEWEWQINSPSLVLNFSLNIINARGGYENWQEASAGDVTGEEPARGSRLERGVWAGVGAGGMPGKVRVSCCRETPEPSRQWGWLDVLLGGLQDLVRDPRDGDGALGCPS